MGKFEFETVHDILPFKKLLDCGKILECENGISCAVFKIVGVDYTLKTSSEISQLANINKLALEELSRLGIMVRVFFGLEPGQVPVKHEYKNKLLNSINEVWNKRFNNTLDRKYYMCISVKDNVEILKSGIDVIFNHLNIYCPSLLARDEIIFFWKNIIEAQFTASDKYLESKVITKNITFDGLNGEIEISEGMQKKYQSALVLYSLSESIKESLLDKISLCGSELLLMISTKPRTVLESISKLHYGQRQSKLMFGTAKYIEESNEVLEKLSNKEDVIVNAQLVVFVKNTSRDSLKKSVKKIKHIFFDEGYVVKNEDKLIEFLWRNLFPSFDDHAYGHEILVSNIADLVRFNKAYAGFSGNDWGGDCIQIFPSANNEKHEFQLHDSPKKHALAHSIMIAPSGSGKTTFFQHIIAGTLKYDIDVYAFDHLCGMKIFTKALGYPYLDVKSDIKFNPFASSTEENKVFTYELMKLLANDEKLNSEIERLVSLMYFLPKESRILNQVSELVFPARSELKIKLKQWLSEDIYGKWINGHKHVNGRNLAYDSLNLNEKFITFDMTHIQKSPDLASAITFYILQRIRRRTESTSKGHLIFLDESKMILSNDYFRKEIESMLLEHRKLRGSINLAFQEPKAIVKLGIQDIVLQQCNTKILFPNINASKEDYELFNLNSFEWDFIKCRHDFQKELKYTVLVKNNHSSVVLDIDISRLGEYVSIYQSGKDKVKIMEKLVSQHGENRWLDQYLQL